MKLPQIVKYSHEYAELAEQVHILNLMCGSESNEVNNLTIDACLADKTNRVYNRHILAYNNQPIFKIIQFGLRKMAQELQGRMSEIAQLLEGKDNG